MADSPRIEELKRRVHSDPASIAFAALAEEYRRAGRFEDAIETCTAGLIRHPSYLSAHVTLGRALIEVGRLEDARNELEYVLRLAPENLAAIRGLAEIHDRLGEGSHKPAAKSQPHEPAAPAMTVAEIHAASGFIRPAAENTEPAPSFAPVPAEPEPVKPQPPFDSGGTTAGSGLASWEAEAFTPPVSFPWEAEPAPSPVPPAWEAEPATTPAEPFAPSIAPALEAEPASSYFVISMEEAAALEAPPALASLSQVEQTPDEPAPRSFDSAPDRSFDSAQDMPSNSAQGRPDRSRAMGLEDFLKAILRARAQRDAFR
ncbi:MAG: tetratricopeptide repeat protein [Actinomycetota bacterium]|nr:tetratricopeptide repeat protein [Actinomycetota bacterium]